MDRTLNVVILTAAKDKIAELRSLVDQCKDRDAARVIYAEIRHLSIKLAAKHNFPAERNLKERKAA